MAADAKYLESITEDLIYEIYREAIVCDHARTFADFKQEHRDAYLRLKMRGMRDWTFDDGLKSDSCAFVFRVDTKATYSPK